MVPFYLQKKKIECFLSIIIYYWNCKIRRNVCKTLVNILYPNRLDDDISESNYPTCF